MSRSVALTFATCAFVFASCGGSPPPDSKTPTDPVPTSSAKATPAPAAVPPSGPQVDEASLPAGFNELLKTALTSGTRGSYGGLTYTFSSEGDKTVAVFVPRPIPRDDTVLLGAIGDVVSRVYKVAVSRARPRIVERPEGNAIGLPTERHTYLVMTIKNVTQEGAYAPGEPHTLLIWRERR